MKCIQRVLVSMSLVLSACQAQLSFGDNPAEINSVQSATQTESVSTPTNPAIETTDTTASASAKSQSSPLRFIFPTPGPAPVSAWRPPLYPTPWAPTPHDHFYFTRPIGADEVNWPLAEYRYGGVFFANVVHTGVDIPAPRGTPVLAAGAGRVTWAGYGLYSQTNDPNDPYGLAVAIRHDFGYQGETLYTVYGHMEEVLVSKGQRVEGGDLIGRVGDTGKVTGVHLHFEVRTGKDNFFTSRNPELWMSPPQGWGILAGRVMGGFAELLTHHKITVRSVDTNQYWEVMTYGPGAANSDPYYRENMVLGDLPAGRYEIVIPYQDAVLNTKIEISPGLVSYFTFRGKNGFKFDLPQLSDSPFTPPDATSTPTPK